MTGPTRRPARGRGNGGRLVVLVTLLALVAAGVVLERRETSVATPHATREHADGANIAAADAISTAWYCAAGTASSGGAADETIVVGNLAPHAIRATVTVEPGGDAAPATRELRVAAYGESRVRVADVLSTPSPGVVVEVFGGRAIVEHELRGNDDVAMGPCAEQPSPTWYLASGGTAKGATQTLELFNPFGDDAIVDIGFITDSGVQEPQAVQGFVVSRRSKARVAVSDLVPRQDRVATTIRARTGRIIAEATRALDASTGQPGLTASLGVTRPRRQWMLPFGDGGSGVTTTVAVVNPALTPTDVRVGVQLPGEGVVAPQTVTVPSRSVVNVDPGARVASRTGFAVVVRATDDNHRIVAETSMSETAGADGRGVATATGAAVAARSWAFAGRPAGTSAAIVALNPGPESVTIVLRAYGGAGADDVTSSPAVDVSLGRIARFDLAALGVAPAEVFVVTANGPVVAGRGVAAPSCSLALGVPVEG